MPAQAKEYWRLYKERPRIPLRLSGTLHRLQKDLVGVLVYATVQTEERQVTDWYLFEIKRARADIPRLTHQSRLPYHGKFLIVKQRSVPWQGRRLPIFLALWSRLVRGDYK